MVRNSGLKRNATSTYICRQILTGNMYQLLLKPLILTLVTGKYVPASSEAFNTNRQSVPTACETFNTNRQSVPTACETFNTNRQNVPTACETFNTNRQNVPTACETFNTNRQTTPNPLRFAPRISQPFHFKLCN